MNESDAKLLTEFLGECWHEVEDADAQWSCCKCDRPIEYENGKVINRTFTTPDDFFAVKRKLVEKGFDRWSNEAEFELWLINPARFCELAAGFLKDSKD
jgi:hypothetical protein